MGVNIMKNMKKVVSFLLAFVMVFAMYFTTAFADTSTESLSILMEDDTIPLDDTWENFYSDIPPGGVATLSGFSIPNRYMAFEAYAILMGGGSTNETFSVILLDHGASKSKMVESANGIIHKNDWIDLRATNNSVDFKLINHGSAGIRVYVKFYCWQ